MSKHTPGPWKVEDWREPGQELPWRSTGKIWATMPSGGSIPIAQVEECQVLCNEKRERIRDDRPEAVEAFEANARLIAAAPEMLAALEQVAMYARINHDRPKDYGEIVAAAIAKAKTLRGGEST